MNRVLRDPLTMFVAVAALLFGVYWAMGRHANAIAVSAVTQAGLADNYKLMTGRMPDAVEKKKLVDDYVTDEILFREAVARGMHLTDRSTRARLVDRLRFLIAGAPKTPAEADLLDFYAEHGELYRAEPQISMTQVYFTKMPPAPEAILAALNRGERIDGDDLWMGRTFPDYGESMLRGMFGAQVVDAARKAPPGVWVGPYPSARGVHYLKIEHRNPPQLMRYTDVRDQVRQDMMAAETAGAVKAAVRKMEAKYDVSVEG